jgi:thioredoxin-related protein
MMPMRSLLVWFLFCLPAVAQSPAGAPPPQAPAPAPAAAPPPAGRAPASATPPAATPAATTAAATTAAATTTATTPSPWLTDFEQAQAAAKASGKPIFAAFTGADWCGYSRRFHDEVLLRPEFLTWARDHVVLLDVALPRITPLPPAQRQHNVELQRRLGVRGLPTVLLLDAAGKQLGCLRYTRGGVRKWLREVEQQLGHQRELAAAELAAAAVQQAWSTDLAAAKARAKAEQKVVLANFTGSDWCGWCMRLQAEVFHTPEFLAWVQQHAVLLEVDFPRGKRLPAELKRQNERLQQELGVDGYPTIVFLDGDGKELGRIGYVEGGPKAWLASAEAARRPAPPAPK